MSQASKPSVFCYKSSFCHISFKANGAGIFKVLFAKMSNIDNGYNFSNLLISLDKYFTGHYTSFNEPLIYNKEGFSGKVLSTLLTTVPVGRTISYAELAKKAGYSGAARAVGSVMAKNNLPLLIPCHRVIASNGSLGGFSSSIDIKNRLIDLERAIAKKTTELEPRTPSLFSF